VESTLKKENWKYKLTLEFIRWNGWSWLWMQNLYGAMFKLWTPIKNDVFWYQKTIVPNTLAQKIEIFQLPKDNWGSGKIYEEGYFWNRQYWSFFDNESLQGAWFLLNILIIPIFTIDSTPNSQICSFCKGPRHVVGNCFYKPNLIPIFVTKPIFNTAQPSISISF